MRIVSMRSLLLAGTAVLAALGGPLGVGAAAANAGRSSDPAWLKRAVLEKKCPSSPVNVPAALLASVDAKSLRQRVSVEGGTLRVLGRRGPNHVVVRGTAAPGVVRVVFDGQPLGAFGPVARVLVRGGAGRDVIIVGPNVGLPARVEGGDGGDCLQAGSGADVLISGGGDDVLVAGTGRPALDAGGGSNRVVVPRRMGGLWATPAADGFPLRQIGMVYGLAPPPRDPGRASQAGPLRPLVLGPADLADASLVRLARRVYAAGEAVTIAGAAVGDAERLRRLLRHPGAAEALGKGERADLVFFRKALPSAAEGKEAPRAMARGYDFRVGIFRRPGGANGAPPAGPRRLDEYRTELLSRVSGPVILATSRAPLRITAEHEYLLAPLELSCGVGLNYYRA